MDAENGEVRFSIDHMLIKLGKYLRILGYDATWNLRLQTHALILEANRENRVFLTRNTRLPDEYPRPTRVLLLTHDEPVQQLAEVVDALNLDVQKGLFSRCIRCNVLLQQVEDREKVRPGVHPNVYERYETFYRCPLCGTVFWQGSHVRNTCRKLGLEHPDSD